MNSETSSRGNRVSAGASSQVNGSGTTSGDEEWRNISTMLSCISGMVDKTKRAISILQHRGTDNALVTHQEATLVSDIKRQTEDKIAEFRRNAEDAVNQVRLQFSFPFSGRLTLPSHFSKTGEATGSYWNSESSSGRWNASHRNDCSRENQNGKDLRRDKPCGRRQRCERADNRIERKGEQSMTI